MTALCSLQMHRTTWEPSTMETEMRKDLTVTYVKVGASGVVFAWRQLPKVQDWVEFHRNLSWSALGSLHWSVNCGRIVEWLVGITEILWAPWFVKKPLVYLTAMALDLQTFLVFNISRGLFRRWTDGKCGLLLKWFSTSLSSYHEKTCVLPHYFYVTHLEVQFTIPVRWMRTYFCTPKQKTCVTPSINLTSSW